MDDSNTCLKTKDVIRFHSHLNAINKHIQFAIETPTVNQGNQCISFLDIEIYTQENGRIEVKVHRKTTRSDKYLSFDSHNPMQDKKAVVKTLLDRADAIPCREDLQAEEKEKVLQDLILNGYNKTFIKKVCSPKNKVHRTQNITPRGFSCLPYIKGTSERIKRILVEAGIKTAFKPVKTLSNVFQRPKERPSENQIKGIVYKFKCKSCPFTYIGETKRSWNSRWLEHKPGVRKRNESAIKDHAEKTGHDVTSTDVEVLERGVTNYHKRIFLEALHSVLNEDSVNEHAELPRPYLPLLRSLGTHRDQLNSPT